MKKLYELETPSFPSVEGLIYQITHHEGLDEIRYDICGITIRVTFYNGEHEWQHQYKIKDKYVIVRISVLGQTSIRKLSKTPRFTKYYYNNEIKWALKKRQELLETLGVRRKKMIGNKVEYFRSYDERRKREVELEASGTRYTEDERVEEFDDFSVTYYILVIGDQYETVS